MKNILIAALLLVLFSGCSVMDLVPKEEDKLCRDYIALLKSGNVEEAAKQLDESIKTPDINEKLLQVAKVIDIGEIEEIKVLNFNYKTNIKNTNKVNYELEYEICYKDAFVHGYFSLVKENGKTTFLGVRFTPLKGPLEEMGKFTMAGKSIPHYSILILVVIAAGFSIYMFVLLLKSNFSKKWLWGIFILIGFTKITVYWNSTDIFFEPLTIQLLSAGSFKANSLAPWAVSVSIPLGAIIFYYILNKREKEKAAQAKMKAEALPAQEPSQEKQEPPVTENQKQE